MHIRLSTEINGHYRQVIAHFERPLFEALKPAGVEMEIVEFTGSKKGDRVHIRFVKPVKGEWISLITDDGISGTEAFFVDEGTVMPFGITKWKHKHIVQKSDAHHSLIIDDLHFETSFFLKSIMIYPVLWIGLFQRKKIYRRFFKNVE